MLKRFLKWFFSTAPDTCKECGQPLKPDMWAGGYCGNKRCSEYSRD